MYLKIDGIDRMSRPAAFPYIPNIAQGLTDKTRQATRALNDRTHMLMIKHWINQSSSQSVKKTSDRTLLKSSGSICLGSGIFQSMWCLAAIQGQASPQPANPSHDVHSSVIPWPFPPLSPNQMTPALSRTTTITQVCVDTYPWSPPHRRARAPSLRPKTWTRAPPGRTQAPSWPRWLFGCIFILIRPQTAKPRLNMHNM